MDFFLLYVLCMMMGWSAVCFQNFAFVPSFFFFFFLFPFYALVYTLSGYLDISETCIYVCTYSFLNRRGSIYVCTCMCVSICS